MENFYITLPSNVVNSEFDNTIANFRTKLASRLEFKGNWEVGLAAMSYTLSWYNLTQEEEIVVRYFDGGSKKYSETIKLQAGRYDTIDELIDAINNQMADFSAKHDIEMPKFVYRQKSRIVYLLRSVFNNRMVFLEMSNTLCRMLGFDKVKMDADSGTMLILYELQLNDVDVQERATWFPDEPPFEKDRLIKATRPFELAGGYHSLFVYCDIVQPSLVGDSNTQLLRFVEIPPSYKYGDQVVLTYPDTHYIPLLSSYFETIEIDIKDDTGETIPFEFGRSIAVLHFRKRL